MTYQTTMQEINIRREKMMSLRKEMRELQAKIEPEEVIDYEFSSVEGPVRLSSLFADKDVLFIIHNMGRSCVYCTQWADGFSGVLDHLQDRAAFVVSSPDSADEQQTFAISRGWRFPLVSLQGTSFAEDMGYVREIEGELNYWPGVSVFQKNGDQISRVSDTNFGPGDDFNAIWHFFDMIPEGPGDWQPRYKY